MIHSKKWSSCIVCLSNLVVEHWTPFSTQDGRGADFGDTSSDVWVATSLVIWKCGSFVQVADREYVVPSGRLTLSTRWIAPNHRGILVEGSLSTSPSSGVCLLQDSGCSWWEHRRWGSREKQSRVSCQKRIGVHIPTGCGNVIKTSKEEIGNRSDSHRWISGTRWGKCGLVQRLRDNWTGAMMLGTAYLGRDDRNHRSLKSGMRWWPDFRHREKYLFTIFLEGQKFQQPPLHS